MLSAVKKEKIIETEITHFSKKGNGVGDLEVPFTIPGDRVLAAKNRKKGNLKELLHPSKDRIAARCVHFGSCGGCRWQQMPYEKQLVYKEQMVKDYFKDLIDPTTQFSPIIACDPPWNYRNKMEFSFSSSRSKEKHLGLIMEGSRGKVFTLEECHLCPPWFVQVKKSVQSWWEQSRLDGYHPYTDQGTFRTLTLREGLRTQEKMVMLTVSGNPEFSMREDEIKEFIECVKEAVDATSIFLRIHQIKKGSPTQFFEMHLYGKETITETLYIKENALDFVISPTAFFQPNTKQAEKLYTKAIELADISKESIVYDLYCGTGTLGISSSKFAKQVIGIELAPESTLDAKENVKNNGCLNVRIETGAVETKLSELRNQNEIPDADIVFIDPPRVGLDPMAIRSLIDLNPKKIVSISCNPVTQAENIRELLSKGWKIDSIQPVDQFPHTAHIENIAILSRKT
ncbi:MAG: 23S rRNA (uracil(1939)-C(5))-methyltransferase RlmD [Waddliaceae bacterium]